MVGEEPVAMPTPEEVVRQRLIWAEARVKELEGMRTELRFFLERASRLEMNLTVKSYVVDALATVMEGRALAGKADPPEDPEAQEIWEGALKALGETTE